MMKLVYVFLFDNEIPDGDNSNPVPGLEIWDWYRFFVEWGYI